MPAFFDKGHFVAIAHLLTAGDVACRVVSVGDTFGVEVSLVGEDRGHPGDKVIWSNVKCQDWSYTRILITDDSLSSGQQSTFRSHVTWDAMPESVAELIATHNYGTPVAAVPD